jgi:hypothetical protein
VNEAKQLAPLLSANVPAGAVVKGPKASAKASKVPAGAKGA